MPRRERTRTALAAAWPVVRTEYGVARAPIVDVLLDLVRRENVHVLGLPRDAIVEALVLARAMPGRPVSDALIAVGARAAGTLPLVTFDRRMARYGVPIREP